MLLSPFLCSTIYRIIIRNCVVVNITIKFFKSINCYIQTLTDCARLKTIITYCTIYTFIPQILQFGMEIRPIFHAREYLMGHECLVRTYSYQHMHQLSSTQFNKNSIELSDWLMLIISIF